MTDPRQALDAAVEALEWFTSPHTLDQVVGVHGESAVTDRRPMRSGLSNDEILSRLTARLDAGPGGKGGHSDPTARDALAGMAGALTDSDRTLEQVDAQLGDLLTGLLELAELENLPDAIPQMDTRDARVAFALRLARQSASRTFALSARPDRAYTVARGVADCAEWLQVRAKQIWKAARGDARPVATQRRLDPCRVCGGWRSGTWAVQNGRCAECRNFHGHHGCERTEAIVRRAEYGKGPTPAQMVEARARR